MSYTLIPKINSYAKRIDLDDYFIQVFYTVNSNALEIHKFGYSDDFVWFIKHLRITFDQFVDQNNSALIYNLQSFSSEIDWKSMVIDLISLENVIDNESTKILKTWG